MLKTRLLLAAWGLLSGVFFGVRAQSIQFSGQVNDYRQHRLLAGSWQWADSMQHPLTGPVMATAAGFTDQIPPKARCLLVTCRGYRSVRLPVSWPTGGTDSLLFRVVIPMVPIDVPITNQPYFQSEQQPLRLSAESGKVAARPVRFSILDALTSRPVRASLCVYPTRTTGPRCYTASHLQTRLVVPDIVAIDVRAPAYQPYLGNVVITDSMGQATLTIRLNPTPTIFMLAVEPNNGPADWALRPLPMGRSYPLTRTGSGHFWGLAPPGQYRLVNTKTNMAPTTDTIHLVEGLTGYALSLPRPLLSESSETVIYFAQSSYELSDSAKHRLDQIAHRLHQQPRQTVQIIGHTDNIGDPQLNLILAEFRARTTRAYLKRCGIGEERLSTEALGAKQPAAPNDTEANRRRNRRVSLLIH